MISAPWIRRGGRGRGDQGRCWPKAIKAPKALGGWATRGPDRFFQGKPRTVFFLLLFCVFLLLEVGSRHFSVFFLKMVCFLLDDDFLPLRK